MGEGKDYLKKQKGARGMVLPVSLFLAGAFFGTFIHWLFGVALLLISIVLLYVTPQRYQNFPFAFAWLCTMYFGVGLSVVSAALSFFDSIF